LFIPESTFTNGSEILPNLILMERFGRSR
jgi:hypothetical protein